MAEGLDSSALAAENDRVAEHGRIRILVADDDPAFLATVRAILGFDERLELVAEAHDGGQAVKLADELLPDVVAMDVAMPGMDGVDEVHIDKDVVLGTKEPVRVYAAKDKTGDAA